MNKFVDDKGLKRYTDNMKLLLKKKVSKKRPYGQIVIGKSINPKSYDWGTIYAFRKNPCITIWSNNEVETFKIRIYGGNAGGVQDVYYESKGVKKTNKKRAIYSHFIRLRRYLEPCGFTVLQTEVGTDICLREVDVPSYNLTGTSKKYSWNSGKRVTSRKGTFEMACGVLRSIFANNLTTHANIVKSYRMKDVIAVPYYMHRVSRGKAYRNKFPNKKRYRTRFTRKSGRIGGGLWLVRFYDRTSRTLMNDIKVYVRERTDKKLLFKRT